MAATALELPPRAEMLRAVRARDTSYEGVFLFGVRSTGIFCRPGCPARTPRPENVAFFAGTKQAVDAGYRPCQRCRPLQPAGGTPEWLRPLLEQIEADPTRRWRGADLRRAGIDPVRARRWFQRHHGLSFHAYLRARRLGHALGHLRRGDPIVDTAFAHGFESLSGFREALEKITGRSAGRSRDTRTLQVTRLESPLGPMLAAADDDGLALLEFVDRRAIETQLRSACRHLDAVLVPGPHRWIEGLERELEEYFAGRRERFETPLRLKGTPFQEAVWRALLEIPYGQTRSYAEQARAIGRPTAVRAVARANGDNRLAIVVPCHRVVGADGRLTGYGGGLWRKQRLLDLERGAASLGLDDPR